MTRPLTEAAHKVGESSIELATYYLGKVLDMEHYFTQRHLPKLGLRFFFGNAYGPFEDRPELGPQVFPPVPSYQIDRGRLENDLRGIVVDMGIELFEGTIVENVALAADGEPHIVHCRDRNGSAQFQLSGRWLVDALGRRRLLQSKLGLMQRNGHSASAAWWRFGQRIDVAELTSIPAKQWHRHTVEDRYMSTNHLMGPGYWVWLIPLSSGATSIGIVTDETIHPFLTYGKSYEYALDWLSKYEPTLWSMIKDSEPLDFHGLKNYSYQSRQIFSYHRWSCVGDAGFFLDPLYSLGSDFIAIGNTITVEMIRQDLKGELTKSKVDQFNKLVLDFLVPLCLDYYKGTYSTFGHAHIFTAKLAWDTSVYWAMMNQLFVQDLIRQPPPKLFPLLHRYVELNKRIQSLFVDWAGAAPSRSPYVHADLTRMRLLQALHLDLFARRDAQQFLEVAWKNLDRLEEFALVLFWQAVEECLPKSMPLQRECLPWINAWRISLTPERWEEDGLFIPMTASRPLQSMRRGTVAGIFAPMTWRERIQIELPYQLMHILRGKPAQFLIQLVLKHFVRGKPAMWVRRLFVMDYPSNSTLTNS